MTKRRQWGPETPEPGRMERGAQVSPGWDAATARRELTGAGVGVGTGASTLTRQTPTASWGSRVKTERGEGYQGNEHSH